MVTIQGFDPVENSVLIHVLYQKLQTCEMPMKIKCERTAGNAELGYSTDKEEGRVPRSLNKLPQWHSNITLEKSQQNWLAQVIPQNAPMRRRLATVRSHESDNVVLTGGCILFAGLVAGFFLKRFLRKRAKP